MDPDRKAWNERQRELRQALSDPAEHARALALFLAQHAAVHARDVSGLDGWCFEEQVWQGLDEAAARRIPPGEQHSIAWCFWHLARIEDVTMNLLLAGTPQVLEAGGWAARLGAGTCDTGNALPPEEIARLSERVDLRALRDYRRAVGERTRAAVRALEPGDLRRKVPPERLRRVPAEGATSEASRGLLDYWGGLTLAGLLLMPPTRHCFVHLNEASNLKKKVLRA